MYGIIGGGGGCSAVPEIHLRFFVSLSGLVLLTDYNDYPAE